MIRKFHLFVLLAASTLYASELKVSADIPAVSITGIDTEISFRLSYADGMNAVADTTIQVTGLPGLDSVRFTGGSSEPIKISYQESGNHRIQFSGIPQFFHIRVIPGWLSLMPPLIAILLALLARQVLVALFVGIWLGTTFIYDYNPFYGLLFSLTEYIGKAAADPDRLSILIFSLVLGGMVGVISKMGGTQGIVEKLARFASTSKRGQFVTWLMGVFIFFDDYANTLIVGNTMRPLTDRLRISREKLSYLVDSTAAPVANIAIISTWIGFELSLIAASFSFLGITANPYITFIKTIPYNFYPIFALSIGLISALWQRDFGPMLAAERRTRQTGKVLADNATPISSLDTREITADDSIPHNWYNGFIPIMVVIATTMLGLWFTGLAAVNQDGIETSAMGFLQYVSTVVGKSDSYSVLMWAAFFGSFTAIIMAVSQKLLSLEHALQAWVGGIKAMIIAALILTMAWSIGNICVDLKTADFVIDATREFLSPHMVPFLSFLIAAIISFATGTSWGVMAILIPIVIPVAHLLPQSDPTIGAALQETILLSTIASVLAGATFGDHCSPISDTTIMSSMASGADHIDHVRTQLPYALLGGLGSMGIGYLPVGYGFSNWMALISGLAVIILFYRFVAKPVAG